MKADNLKSIALLFAVLLPMAEVSLGDTFVSSAFTLDMRLENGRRIARGTEAIRTCAIWDAGDFATVTQTRPGGSPATIHTTSGTGVESVSWDAKHAEPGDHLFTHVTSRGGSTVATYSVTFEVPEPSLEAIRIFGPTNFYSGNSAEYTCMGYFSDDSGREITPAWSIIGNPANVSVAADGTLSVGQSSTASAATLRAVATVNGSVQTNELAVSFGAAHLSLGERRLIFENSGGEKSVTVHASGEWTATSSDPWLVISAGHGVGDGMLAVACGVNPETMRRLATVTVRCGDLPPATLQVMQYPGEEKSFVTVRFDTQGGSAPFKTREYEVGGIYGTLPSATLPGKIFGGWWTSAGGQGTRILVGSEVAAAVQRLYAYWRDISAADALDNSLNLLSHSDEPWVIDQSVSRCGGASMRSGAIDFMETSTIIAEVTGPGKLSFWWRTSSDDWDWLAFYDVDDHQPVKDISGETDWTHVEYRISDSATHYLKWSYEKYSGTAAGRDCAWLDEVVWIPDFGVGDIAPQSLDDHVAPAAWREMFGLGNASLDLDSDGDGMTDWEEYVTGTNPLDPASLFWLLISMDGDTPMLTATPDLGTSREYIFEGKADLSDENWVSPTNSTHRFFRARVNLK